MREHKNNQSTLTYINQIKIHLPIHLEVKNKISVIEKPTKCLQARPKPLDNCF